MSKKYWANSPEYKRIIEVLDDYWLTEKDEYLVEIEMHFEKANGEYQSKWIRWINPDIEKGDDWVPEHFRTIALLWIRRFLWPSEDGAVNTDHTSYGLKHLLERYTGIYLTNDQFKKMMIESGYVPYNEDGKYASDELNPFYAIDPDSPAFMWDKYGKRWNLMNVLSIDGTRL